jgi:hypothetical protein
MREQAESKKRTRRSKDAPFKIGRICPKQTERF